MHLTRIILNPERTGTRFLLSSPQRLHAAVMKSFSQETLDHMQSRPLWYVETKKRDPELYILAPVPADTTHIAEQAGRPLDTKTQISKSYHHLLNNIHPGARYLFKVQLNPVIRHQGKNLPHVTEEQIAEWFKTKAVEQWGFEVTSLALSNRDNSAFNKKQGERGTRITLSTVLAQGTLTITNESVFRYAFENGLGKAKAYGCGLLFLGRAPEVEYP